MSGARLLQKVWDLGYTGGYTAVTGFLREVRPPAHNCDFKESPQH